MTMGGNNMSLTLEQYLALSVFDYDKIEPGYKTSELAYVAKSDIPYPSQVCLIYQSSGNMRYFTNQLLYGII